MKICGKNIKVLYNIIMLSLLCAEAFSKAFIDFKFYAILITLAVVLVFICVLFARNDKFKEKAKKNVIIEKPYESPTIISVKEKNK